MDRTNRLASILANGIDGRNRQVGRRANSLGMESGRKEAADEALANYDFGEDDSVDQATNWQDSGPEDPDEWTCKLSMSSGGVRGFIVRFAPKSSIVQEAYPGDYHSTSSRGASRSRVAQPLDEDEYHPDEHITPPITEVDPRAKIYRDTDDLREEADEDEDEHERGEKSVLLFGGDAGDDGLDDDDADVGKDTLRKSRLKLLAGQIWAQLGEADAVVEESAPNELSVRVQDLSWKITVADDGKVKISGFDSGAEQFVGQLPDEDAEAEIIKISDHIHQLIAEDIDEKSTPAEPPVHFGPEDTGVEEETEGETSQPPVAPGGDEGFEPETGAVSPDLGAPPSGGEMPFGAAQPAPAAPGGMPPMGAAPPAAPMAPGAPPAPGPTAPFPIASRRRMRLPAQVKRVATARLETTANALESIGESLGEDGEEVFGDLAERVRSVVNWID